MKGPSTETIPSLLQSAKESYRNRNFSHALEIYKGILKTYENCPASIRMAMGHCFFSLGQEAKARMAFRRALEIDPHCPESLIGLGVLDINSGKEEAIREGTSMIARAYHLKNFLQPSKSGVQPTAQDAAKASGKVSAQATALNQLANHFFFAREMDKVRVLALKADQLLTDAGPSKVSKIHAEAFFHIAKSFHFEKDYESAFRFYSKATKEADPATFALPFYGLGQMYLAKDEFKNAQRVFELILKHHPKNYETRRVLAWIYSQSKAPSCLAKAKDLLKLVVDSNPKDVEALVDFAQVLENSEPEESLKKYEEVMRLMVEEIEVEVPVEIFTNMGTLYSNLGRHEEALQCYERAIERTPEESLLRVTMSYNLACTHKARRNTERAEALFKKILKDHPNYVDCYFQLGQIARAKGEVHEADELFKEAFRVDTHHPNAWCLMGNLRVDRKELDLAVNKYKVIAENAKGTSDIYALIAMGNIRLHSLHIPTKNLERKKQSQKKAMYCYLKVLNLDRHNVWAANGVAAVLAYQGHVSQAKDLFTHVRDSRHDFSEARLNIAHILVQQKHYLAATQIYAACLESLPQKDHVDVAMYIAKAFFKAEKYEEAREHLMKARLMRPEDNMIMYNTALVLKKMATATMKEEKPVLKKMLRAQADLKFAQETFSHLSQVKVMPLLRAEAEAGQCKDLLNQVEWHVTRARETEETEAKMKKQREADKEAYAKKVQEQKRLKEEEEALRIQELERQRQEFVEMNRRKLKFQDSEGEDNLEDGKKRKKKTSKKTKGRKRSNQDVNESDDEDREVSKRKKVRKSNTKTEREENSRFLSKATINSSDENSDSEMDTQEIARDSQSGADSPGSVRSRQSDQGSEEDRLESRDQASGSASDVEQQDSRSPRSSDVERIPRRRARVDSESQGEDEIDNSNHKSASGSDSA